MSDPKTRALEHLRLAEAYLNDRSEVMDWHVHVAEELQALRLAITQIPTTSWQPIETLDVSTMRCGEPEVALLCQAKNGKRRVIHRCSHSPAGNWWIAGINALSDYWTPIAWRPADSTELPEDWGRA